MMRARAAIALALLAGCATPVPAPVLTAQERELFADATSHAGQQVEVRGWLHRWDEGTGLFPDADERFDDCLPILFRSAELDLVAQLERRDRSYVRVRGVVVDLAEPGKQVVGACKSAGLHARSVEVLHAGE